MIVQTIFRILLFYFIFRAIRGLLKGFAQVKNAQNTFKGHHEEPLGPKGQRNKSRPDEDVVEAEFRRL